jgi:hypothetical protein
VVAESGSPQVWRVAVRKADGAVMTFEVVGDEDEIEGLCQDIAWTHWQTSASQVEVPSASAFREMHRELFEAAAKAPLVVRGHRHSGFGRH